jgi:hypothetical protein
MDYTACHMQYIACSLLPQPAGSTACSSVLPNHQ